MSHNHCFSHPKRINCDQKYGYWSFQFSIVVSVYHLFLSKCISRMSYTRLRYTSKYGRTTNIQEYAHRYLLPILFMALSNDTYIYDDLSLCILPWQTNKISMAQIKIIIMKNNCTINSWFLALTLKNEVINLYRIKYRFTIGSSYLTHWKVITVIIIIYIKYPFFEYNVLLLLLKLSK